MSQLRQMQLLAGVLLAAGACASAVAPSAQATVTIRATRVDAVVTVAGSVTWVQFTLPLRFENTGGTPVSLEPCASYLESRSAATWSTAWSPICSASGESLKNIPPGQSRDTQIEVIAALAGPGAPRWEADGLGGLLRYQAGYAFQGLRGRIPTVASNEFTLHKSR